MKKLLLVFSVSVFLITLSACSKNSAKNDQDFTPTAAPTTTATEDTKEDVTGSVVTETPTGGLEDTLTVGDFYPLKADTEYVYEGTGNEFASFTMNVDFLDTVAGKLQTRTNNGGTETVRVLEMKDGKLVVNYTVDECYYRENFMDKAVPEKESEVLLMEPLIVGTSWTLPNGRRRYISGYDIVVQTPSGKYKALEVTTEDESSQTKDYYAKGTGLVKTVFQSEGIEMSSALSKINQNTPFSRELEVYYPDADGKIYAARLPLTFHTGDVTREVINEVLKADVPKASYLPLISKNTRIYSLYLGVDGIVYVDFSKELVTEMNAGAGYELLILQGLTNTFGMYYGAGEVYLTIDGKPYESGHVLMKKGETMKVNMDNVITK
jgi:spore germination protein GerM